MWAESLPTTFFALASYFIFLSDTKPVFLFFLAHFVNIKP